MWFKPVQTLRIMERTAINQDSNPTDVLSDCGIVITFCNGMKGLERSDNYGCNSDLSTFYIRTACYKHLLVEILGEARNAFFRRNAQIWRQWASIGCKTTRLTLVLETTFC